MSLEGDESRVAQKRNLRSKKKEIRAAQNRAHQQNSRARRKEYIAELEMRLLKCSREGVQATIQVQEAARKVAEENRHLRRMLRAYGINVASSEAVKALANLDGTLASSQQTRRAFDKDIILSNEKQSTRYIEEAQLSGLQGVPVHLDPVPDVAKPGGSKLAPAMHSDSASKMLITPMGRNTEPVNKATESAQANPESKNQQNHDDMARQQNHTSVAGNEPPPVISLSSCSGSCSVVNTEKSKCPSDETYCEKAAQLIAAMRGLEDPETLWEELGCSSQSKCMIKNSQILQMA